MSHLSYTRSFDSVTTADYLKNIFSILNEVENRSLALTTRR